jgi:hypothetical protein
MVEVRRCIWLLILLNMALTAVIILVVTVAPFPGGTARRRYETLLGVTNSLKPAPRCLAQVKHVGALIFSAEQTNSSISGMLSQRYSFIPGVGLANAFPIGAGI